MRNMQFGHNEYYHLCGRGLDRQTLFRDTGDFLRFLFLILYLQSPAQIHNIGSSVSAFLKHGSFGVTEERKIKLTKDKSLELVSFALMPNHFHLLVRNVEEGAVSVYMHRTLMAYGKYFNTKYERFGHVFDGPFRSVHLKKNEQLLYTSSYIHKNPKSLPEFEHKYDEYPWSSYQDYTTQNRWPALLHTEILLGQFKSQANFRHFTETSVAKESELDLLI